MGVIYVIKWEIVMEIEKIPKNIALVITTVLYSLSKTCLGKKLQYCLYLSDFAWVLKTIIIFPQKYQYVQN